MGRVFTYEELSTGQIPEPKDFDRAIDIFQDVVQYPGEVIDGAFIYGSAAIGATNRRSDLDVFFSVEEIKHIGAVRHIVRRIGSETGGKIPIMPIVQTRTDLEAGRHEMDRFFGQHLSSDHRLVVGNDPAEYIRYADFGKQSARDILALYIAQKKRRLTNAYIDDPMAIENGGIHRMLELPGAIARKALQALAEFDQGVEPVEKSADKDQLAIRGLELMQDFGIGEGFERLLTMDRDYSRDFDNYTDDKAGYSELIMSLHDEIPGVLAWLRSLEDVVLPDLES